MKLVALLLRVLGVLLVLLVVAVGVVAFRGRQILLGHRERPVADLTVVADSALIERGRHIAEVSCASCHGDKGSLPLSGGSENFFAIPDGPNFGVCYAPNITPGGRLAAYTRDGELARVIREGINREGRSVIVMPSESLRRLSDDDLHALIAYLRSQPAVKNEPPALAPNLLAFLLLGSGMFPPGVQPAIAGEVPAIPADSTAAYGEYVLALNDCRTCHGADLRGGKKGQFPPIGPDLVAVAHQGTRETFFRALRQGIAASGKPLNPSLMPWVPFSRMSDLEIAAIYAYLTSLPR